MQKIQLLTEMNLDPTQCPSNIKSFERAESFDDYDINVIDLTCGIWETIGSTPDEIDDFFKIQNLANMLKVSHNSKTIVVLPQNINFLFYKPYGYSKYKRKVLLMENLNLVQEVVGNLINAFKPILSYNRTNTKIEDNIIYSDFVFAQQLLNIKGVQVVTKSNRSSLITTIVFKNVYLTTLDLFDESENLINFLKHIGLITDQQIAPEWFENVRFLDDNDLIEQKTKNITEQEKLEKELLCLNKKLDVNNYYKSILYKSGPELVDVVNKMLQEMLGYDPSKFQDIKKEDFLIELEKTVFVGEIKGISTNVKRDNISQTEHHQSEYLDAHDGINKKVVPLLIINRQRDKSIDKRDKINDDIIKLAIRNEVLIILAETFLKIYEHFRQGKLSQQKIEELLKTHTGLLEEKDFY